VTNIPNLLSSLHLATAFDLSLFGMIPFAVEEVMLPRLRLWASERQKVSSLYRRTIAYVDRSDYSAQQAPTRADHVSRLAGPNGGSGAVNVLGAHGLVECNARSARATYVPHAGALTPTAVHPATAPPSPHDVRPPYRSSKLVPSSSSLHDDLNRVHRVKAKPLRGRFASLDTSAAPKRRQLREGRGRSRMAQVRRARG
jgi:hypothetical protein